MKSPGPEPRSLQVTRARSGLTARGAIGVVVLTGSGRSGSKIDDDAWRWHIGLDAGATALNDQPRGREVAPEQLQRFGQLFSAGFVNNWTCDADVATASR
jgi:hypothetical protein